MTDDQEVKKLIQGINLLLTVGTYIYSLNHLNLLEPFVRKKIFMFNNLSSTLKSVSDKTLIIF